MMIRRSFVSRGDRPDLSRPLIMPIPPVMKSRSIGSTRLLIGATLAALLTLISTIDATEPDTCSVALSPSKFNHQRLTLKGMAVGVKKSASRTGSKEMTFLLTGPAGCGSLIVYFQGLATLSNGDHIEVEGTFETRHLRDGSIFNNEMQATKITPLPR
jgi:enterochelin esterase-like enzyme